MYVSDFSFQSRYYKMYVSDFSFQSLKVATTYQEMEPIEKFYASSNITQSPLKFTGWSRQKVVDHLRAAYHQRGSDRGIAVPLPPDLDKRSTEELVKLASHYYSR